MERFYDIITRLRQDAVAGGRESNYAVAWMVAPSPSKGPPPSPRQSTAAAANIVLAAKLSPSSTQNVTVAAQHSAVSSGEIL